MIFLRRYKKYIMYRGRYYNDNIKIVKLHDYMLSFIAIQSFYKVFSAIIKNARIRVFIFRNIIEIYIEYGNYLNVYTDGFLLCNCRYIHSNTEYEYVMDGICYYTYNFRVSQKCKKLHRCIIAPEYVAFEAYRIRVIRFFPVNGIHYNIICHSPFINVKKYDEYYKKYVYNRCRYGCLVVCNNNYYLSRAELAYLEAILRYLCDQSTPPYCNEYNYLLKNKNYQLTPYIGGTNRSDFVIHYRNIQTIDYISGTYVACDGYYIKDEYKPKSYSLDNSGYDYKILYKK